MFHSTTQQVIPDQNNLPQQSLPLMSTRGITLTLTAPDNSNPINPYIKFEPHDSLDVSMSPISRDNLTLQDETKFDMNNAMHHQNNYHQYQEHFLSTNMLPL
jgi:hypothetical protein